MPKESNKTDRKQRRKWPLFIVGVVVLSVGATVYLNKDRIAPLVVDIPVLNTLFPVVSEDPYANLSKEQLVEEAKNKETELESIKNELQAAEETIKQLEANVETLRTYQTQNQAFIEDKAAWDEEIARANPELFIEQYELMNPDVAERVYAELVAEQVITQQQQKQAKTIAEMDEAQAARAIESLMASGSELDRALVKALMLGMAIDEQADILSEMDTDYATQVIRLISPEQS